MLWDDFLNSKVNAFQDVLNSKIYIDKTGLLEYTNSVIDTTSKFICNSRPRRFGKSITADMMTAYYSRSLDTEEMFEKLNIGQAANQKIQDELYNPEFTLTFLEKILTWSELQVL